MHLQSLRLQDFRSYHTLLMTPPKGVIVIIGENGTGKTNLLEAIHLCCIGKSHRTNADGDMIAHEASSCAVQLVVSRNDGHHDVGIRLYRQQRKKKLLYLNGKVAPRLGEMMGHATCVMFSPEDLNIVKDGPAQRRRFLDMLLCQCQGAYFYALQTYNACLKQRNALLKSLKFGGDANQLDVWDRQLANASTSVVRFRHDAIATINTFARAHYAFIADTDTEKLVTKYHSQIDPQNPYETHYNALKQARNEDIRRQTTSVGPHRDDILLTLKDKELRSFGSQGQMRTAALSLKLGSFDLLAKTQGEAPLLLLDDVLSELDPKRRRKLIERIKDAQAFLTCTDASDFIGATPACVLEVNNGSVREYISADTQKQ